MTLALLAGYMLFGNVMLLNLLIAIFTSVFEEIQANSKEVTISIIFEELRWPGVEMGDVQAGRGVRCSARSRSSSWLSSITLEIIIIIIALKINIIINNVATIDERSVQGTISQRSTRSDVNTKAQHLHTTNQMEYMPTRSKSIISGLAPPLVIIEDIWKLLKAIWKRTCRSAHVCAIIEV